MESLVLATYLIPGMAMACLAHSFIPLLIPNQEFQERPLALDGRHRRNCLCYTLLGCLGIEITLRISEKSLSEEFRSSQPSLFPSKIPFYIL